MDILWGVILLTSYITAKSAGQTPNPSKVMRVHTHTHICTGFNNPGVSIARSLTYLQAGQAAGSRQGRARHEQARAGVAFYSRIAPAGMAGIETGSSASRHRSP